MMFVVVFAGGRITGHAYASQRRFTIGYAGTMVATAERARLS